MSQNKNSDQRPESPFVTPAGKTAETLSTGESFAVGAASGVLVAGAAAAIIGGIGWLCRK